MNFIAATVELRGDNTNTVNAYGLDYRSADAVVPASGSNNEVRLRLLCYNREGAKLTAFSNWKEPCKLTFLKQKMFDGFRL